MLLKTVMLTMLMIGCSGDDPVPKIAALEARVGVAEARVTALQEAVVAMSKVSAPVDAGAAVPDPLAKWFCGPVMCARTEADCSFMQRKLSATRPDDDSLKVPCTPKTVAYSADPSSGYYTTMDWCRKAVAVGESKTMCVEHR